MGGETGSSRASGACKGGGADRAWMNSCLDHDAARLHLVTVSTS